MPEAAAKCKWCDEGNPRTRSSVTERYVHTDTPMGRVLCGAGPLVVEFSRALVQYQNDGGRWDGKDSNGVVGEFADSALLGWLRWHLERGRVLRVTVQLEDTVGLI